MPGRMRARSRARTGGHPGQRPAHGCRPLQTVIDLAMDPSSPETVYAGTDEGVFKSTDGGASWIAANSGLADFTTVFALAIVPSSPETVYAGTFADGAYTRARMGGHRGQRLTPGCRPTQQESSPLRWTRTLRRRSTPGHLTACTRSALRGPPSKNPRSACRPHRWRSTALRWKTTSEMTLTIRKHGRREPVGHGHPCHGGRLLAVQSLPRRRQWPPGTARR